MPYVKEFALKDIDTTDGGNIVAYAATFDREPDSYGDVIKAGAFAETIEEWQESGDPIPLLYAHDTQDPYNNIGSVIKASEDERGLRVEAMFDPESERAQYVRKLVLERRVRKMSFAYDILEDGEIELEGGAKAHELRKLRIFEVSIVPIPANQHADIVDAKSGAVKTKYGKTISRKSNEVISDALQTIHNNLLELDEIKDSINKACESLSSLIDDVPSGSEEDIVPEDEANEEGSDANSESEKSRALLSKINQKLGE